MKTFYNLIITGFLNIYQIINLMHSYYFFKMQKIKLAFLEIQSVIVVPIPFCLLSIVRQQHFSPTPKTSPVGKAVK